MAKRKRMDKQETLNVTNQFNESAIKLAEELKIKSFGFDIPEQLFQDASLKYRIRFNLLNQFKETIEELRNKDHLEGSHILFGKRSAIDNKGRLVLCANELVSDWIPHLENYSQDKAVMNIRYAKSRTLLEQKVAEVLGIAQFYCSPELENSYTYEALKNNILKEFKSTKKEWPGSIKVKVSSLTQSPQAECSTGTIVIPIARATPDIVFKYLQANGTDVNEQFKAFKETAENIRKFYNLISLSYQTAPDLNDDQLWECFSRLAEGASSLVPYLSGVRLHVARDYGMNEEGNLLSIKWDYLVD